MTERKLVVVEQTLIAGSTPELVEPRPIEDIRELWAWRSSLAMDDGKDVEWDEVLRHNPSIPSL